MKPIRTVLIDDAVELRYLIARALAASGRFEVVGHASDGREGIDVVTELRPELVLLDLSMPVMDGLEALPHLRRQVPEAKIVVLSGHPDSLAADRAFQGGATAYVEKGASPTLLVETLTRAVGAPREEHVARPPVEPPETFAVVGQLAHDLRTPLASAAGFVDLLRRSLPEGTEPSVYAERAASAVARLTRLVDATVAYAREGHGALQLRPLRLEAAVGAVIEDLGSKIPAVDTRVHVDVGDAQVRADELGLHRVLQNLLHNALTYSDGPVEVTAQTAGEAVSITVSDSGPGLLASELPGLFTPFHRGGLGRERGGTGLGLALAARLVNQMGGSISARNREAAPGAVFELELRRASPPQRDELIVRDRARTTP